MKVCTQCGTTWEEIYISHSMGCVKCYEVFSDELHSTYPVLLGPLGKVEKKAESNIQEKQIEERFATIFEIRESLSRALLQENFEEANKLKQKLSKLENGKDLD